jgi:hypothetical protein
LPTYLWQKQQHTFLRDVSPPLVLRVWMDLNKVGRNATYRTHLNALVQLAEQIAGGSPYLPHIFGIKVPHFKFGGLSRRLASTLRRSKQAATIQLSSNRSAPCPSYVRG